jgi:hypothetical protein
MAEFEAEESRGKSEPAIMVSLSKLAAVIDRLEGQRNHLHDRLEPVLGPHDVPSQASTASELKTVSPYSEVTRSIRDAMTRVDAVAEDLAGMLLRLEV